MKKRIIFPLLVLLLLPSCKRTIAGKPEIWVYTSMYKHVVDSFEKDLVSALPNVKVNWFQAGSEKVMARLEAEEAAGGMKADVVLISDPFWYQEAKKKGLLVPYDSPYAQKIPATLKDSEELFVTARIPVMVLAYNRMMLSSDIPASFSDLLQEKWRGKIAIGSPLESGSHFTTAANLSRRYGWDFYRKLRQQNVFCSGGNSTVMTKLLSKEYPVGILLLEDILQRKMEDPQAVIEPIYPADGVILIPSPIAILKRTRQIEAAKQFYDYILSERGQNLIVKGSMYSPLPDFASPQGARTFKELFATAFPFNEEFLDDVVARHAEIKREFSAIMFE